MSARLPSLSRVAILLVAGLALTGCSSGGDDTDPAVTATDPGTGVDADQSDRFPEVLDVVATRDDATGTWSFAVTISSPYDTPERYADGWRVLGPDGTEFGVHTLTHDHATEQPFTRTQTGVEIPTDVDEVTIEGRDLVNGFGGPTFTIDLQAGTP
ncbi:MAG: hypothetical protein R8G01_05615 [Ilumatobacteraceae bacterium]|nr:hypothetical protein [Ilumatobacteraceae bacterium]